MTSKQKLPHQASVMDNIHSDSAPFRFTQAAEAPFAWYAGRVVSRGQLWADVRQLATQLPNKAYLFNVCENRYLFCVCLLAGLTRGQICLLPPSSQAAVIEEIQRDYPGAYLAGDGVLPAIGLDCFEVTAPDSEQAADAVDIDWQACAVIAFTSGSTGRAKPCAHSLHTFASSASMAVASLGLADQQRLVISTTPPQHMYGLETSVFWPLFSRLILHDGRPFFAEDIRRLVADAPWPSMLASTPTHLRALLSASGDWSRLRGIISATDTLSDKLAGELAAVLGSSPQEIYGSTETLSFASRQSVLDSLWQPYAGCQLAQMETGQTQLQSPHLPQATELQDVLQLHCDGRFAVSGRHGDMLKIGGKRASLSEMNRRLLDVAGVEDGFCYVMDNGRLAAVVVGQLDKSAIRAGLQPFVDEVFLPRKLHFVTAIPRNASGKLLKAELDRLLAQLDGRDATEGAINAN